jgi:hypothetical protein
MTGKSRSYLAMLGMQDDPASSFGMRDQAEDPFTFAQAVSLQKK